MQSILEFMLRCTVLWLLGWLAYRFLLQQQGNLSLHRAFLLLSLVAPPLVFGLGQAVQAPLVHYMDGQLLASWINSQSQNLAQPLQNTWPWWLGLLSVGIALGLLRLSLSLYWLWRLQSRAERSEYEGFSLLRLPNSNDCYTFFGYIVIGDGISANELPMILAHERAHQRLRHSLDAILCELYCICFWFHPLVYLHRQALRQLHEYQADRLVLEHYPRREYADLLLQRAMNTHLSFFHPFAHFSQLKNRLKMMTLSPQTSFWKSAFSFLSLPLLMLLLLQNQTQAQIALQPDQMPVYGNCPNPADAQCSTINLMTDLSKTLTYPPNAKEQGIQGKVILEFVVNAQGKIQDSKVLRSLNPECDREALRALEALPQAWKPGLQAGKAVAVRLVLPIQFSVQD